MRKCLSATILKNLKSPTNEKDKTIVIQQMPKPEIISIDTDIKIENLSSGLFTDFSEQELSKNPKDLAKDKIRQKALSAELVKQAEEQKKDVMGLIFYMASQNGYKIIVEGTELKPLMINNVQ